MPPDSVPRLLDDVTLELSSVVANNAMNRGRGLAGVNSYARELGFDPYERLAERLRGDDRPAPRFPATYLGADDAAGPGYTGQPSVRSHYAW
ncbi:hypothetical protein ACFU44_11755 [Nocardia rhizosphaerihabitans]|uniref:hypothetical protein n=1 Tax=Nocardia rhizosphaerihabitans TaxID=1691570 RepID=UPI00366FAD12